MASIERLSGWDYATWRSAGEDPTMRSTMIGLMVLDRSPDWERLVERYERASRVVPILRQKIVEGPVGFANPRVVVDPQFDLTFHLRRFMMPEDSTWDDVLDECRRQSMTDFDKERPLWKVTLLEGLPGGRAALLSKLHHAIADGQGALQLGAALVDISEEGFDLGPMPEAPESVELSARHFAEIMIHDNTEWVLSHAVRAAKAAVPTVKEILANPTESVMKVSETVQSLARMANTPTEPNSPIMRSRSINYHFTNFNVSFDDLRAAAKAQGHTINDAFLTAIALGMREYHLKHDAPVDSLHLNMPISTRQAGKDAKNAVSIARFDLPTNSDDVAGLMDHLGAEVKRVRAEPAIEYTNELGEISRFIPTELLTTGAKASDVTASNVPGPPIEVWLAGAKVQAIVPMPPPIGAAVFVALLSYNGTAAIGCAIDDAAVKDRDVLTECLAHGFEKVTGKKVTSGDPLTPAAKSSTKAVRKSTSKASTARKK